MGVLDFPLRGVAKTLIGILGATATLRRHTSTYDPLTGDQVVTEVTWTLKVSPPDAVKLNRIDGTLVRAGDAISMISSSVLEALTPPPGLPGETGTTFYLDVASDRWSVVAVNDLRSGDQSAALELILRR